MERKFFPFRPLDYRAAEEWLNIQAEQGLELMYISSFSFAHFRQADTPRRYAVALWPPTAGFDKVKREEFEEYEGFLATFGWEHKADKDSLRIFEASETTLPPLESDPAAEAMQIRRQYWSGMLTNMAVIVIALLVYFFMALDNQVILLLSRPIFLFGFLFMGCMAAVYVIQLLLFLRFRRASLKALEEGVPLPARPLRAAWRNGMLYFIGCALFAGVLIAALIGDAVQDISHIQDVFRFSSVFFAGQLGVAMRQRQKRKHAYWAKIVLFVAMIILSFVGLARTLSLRNENVTELEGLPVLHMQAEKTNNNALYHSATPLLSLYKFTLHGENYTIYSYCTDSATDALADFVFRDTAKKYAIVPTRYVSYNPVYEAYDFPGADSALIDWEHNVLILRLNRRVVCVNWWGDIDLLSDPAYIAQIAESFFA